MSLALTLKNFGDDDSPHFELYMRGIIAFSEYTWSGDQRTKEEIKSAYRQREFSHTLASGEFAFIDELEKPVAFWKNALLKGSQRNHLQKNKKSQEESVIDLPNAKDKGQWSKLHSDRLEQAAEYYDLCDSIAAKITKMKSKANRNVYTLEIYEQVNKLVQFTVKSLLILNDYDLAETNEEESESMSKIVQLQEDFNELRKEFELVYSKTRILTKPANYILDQDHHTHSANQSISFDWQFFGEIFFLDKIQKELL